MYSFLRKACQPKQGRRLEGPFHSPSGKTTADFFIYIELNRKQHKEKEREKEKSELEKDQNTKV
jgi:hypothetical protein